METSAVRVKLSEQLLPGMPDDITLQHIAPKLPWTTFHTLSSVSHTWLDAIRRHLVYDARVRSHSTETLVLVDYFRSDYVHAIGLYSMRDGSIHELPPIPHLEKGIPRSCQVVSLNGKVYVLGGEVESNNAHLISNKVYVMDLAGQKQWAECASMKQRRKLFGCGVAAGKIYVFGGIFPFEHFGASEVYDPEENKWSSIAPMASFRLGHVVETVGEELLLHSGVLLHSDYYFRRQVMNPIDIAKPVTFWDFYHSVTDEWRRVESFGEVCLLMFLAKGEVHSVRLLSRGPGDHFQIRVYDVEKEVWTDMHSCSFAGLGGFGPTVLCLVGIRAVNDELLARVDVKVNGRPERSYLLQFEGIGGKERRIVWEEKAQFSVPETQKSSMAPTMYPIQL